MKTLVAAIIIFLNLSTIHWEQNFENAQREAQLSGKYILLNFSGSDWCAPCIKLKKDIFESAEFEQYASNHLVLVKADFPRLKKNQLPAAQTTHNESLAERYNPQGKFPLTLLLDSNGKILQEWEGYPRGLTTEGFIKEIGKYAH